MTTLCTVEFVMTIDSRARRIGKSDDGFDFMSSRQLLYINATNLHEPEPLPSK